MKLPIVKFYIILYKEIFEIKTDIRDIKVYPISINRAVITEYIPYNIVKYPRSIINSEWQQVCFEFGDYILHNLKEVKHEHTFL